ncbi:response regulator [Ulvibacter antarcticus]|uniref:Response regulator receiver domain-containing protein n=1 Tax=Ulvibacter antarcticus TaxID=442714 RepID=A0A3L9ZI53_9FLAO|nr:response regulator [Ulvibacter antarcticus]RMA66392.1 response regulator receiver domain-containing protein [Ulvibacter antarcticus]
MEKQKAHILIVEDSENILSLLELMLDINGWKVSSRDNTVDIIEHLQLIKPNLILMDMLLSGSNGCDACRLIKMTPKTRHIPIVMMSAHPSGELESSGAGADYFISKPFEMDELIELINSGLNRSRIS